MKKIIIIGLLITAVTSFSQDFVKKINFKINKGSSVFQIVEEDKKQFSFFFSDENNVKSIKFNDKFEVLDSLSSTRPEDKYNDIAGYSITGNKYYTYWFTSNNKEIGAQCFDFDKKDVWTEDIKIELLREKIIKKITINNVFYIITILKNTNILNFYVFKEGKLEKKSIDLSDKNFINDEGKASDFWDVLNSNSFIESSLSVQNIMSDTPPSIALAAKKRKIYTDKNNLIFTSDVSVNFTQILTINLTNFTTDLKSINQSYYEIEEYKPIKSNSFLLGDKLLQIKNNPDRLTLQFKDLEGNEIKNYEVLADTQIPFKNSEIIQENGTVKSTRILDKTNQLVRKISNLYPGISCYVKNDKTYLTLGAVSEVQSNNSGAMIGGMLGGFTGSLIGVALSSNYSVDNLNSYANRKVVYINCLFDNKLEHLDGVINKLPIDNLRAFSEENPDYQFKTIFKLNNELIFGGYEKKKKEYSFFKFKD